jgi:hypothetical protein
MGHQYQQTIGTVRWRHVYSAAKARYFPVHPNFSLRETPGQQNIELPRLRSLHTGGTTVSAAVYFHIEPENYHCTASKKVIRGLGIGAAHRTAGHTGKQTDDHSRRTTAGSGREARTETKAEPQR